MARHQSIVPTPLDRGQRFALRNDDMRRRIFMARMKREEWYNIARDVDWTLSYADEEAVFPE